LKIVSVELYHVCVKLKKPFVTSLSVKEYTNSIFVKIKTSSDLVGLGECCPTASINGETHETCFVVGRMIAKRFIGQNPLDIDANVGLMDQVIYGNTSIKSAFDIALYDLAAKAKGCPLYEYLGGAINKRIFTDYTVSLGPVAEMVQDAVKVKDDGFKIIKIKVGGEGKEDVKRVGAIRKAVGADIELRIDANQGWGVEEALATLIAMKDFDIAYCEEPIKRYKFDMLPSIREKSPIKIMADESVLDHYDAHRLINTGACDYINIKLGKSAGIYKALKIIKAAQKIGMKLQLGGFVESNLLFTANCHLAHTADCCSFYDFDSPLFAKENPIIGGMKYGEHGEITLNDAPGLGLEIDERYLKHANKLIIT